jgi:hypothetical protein
MYISPQATSMCNAAEGPLVAHFREGYCDSTKKLCCLSTVGLWSAVPDSTRYQRQLYRPSSAGAFFAGIGRLILLFVMPPLRAALPLGASHR